MLLMKPHHFIDILTGYGNNVTVFEPNAVFGHALHKVAHDILNDPDIKLCLTDDGDTICGPCRNLSEEGVCIHIEEKYFERAYGKWKK